MATVPHRLDDTSKLQCSYGCAGQERGEQEMVARADDYRVKQLLVHLLENAVAAPARAQYHQLLPSPLTV